MIIILIISLCTENSNIISGQNDSKMVKAHAEIQKRGAKPSPQVYLLRPPLGDIQITHASSRMCQEAGSLL